MPGSNRANGEEILRIARKHLGEKYILGALAPKNNSKWKGPWDCAEFASWIVYQVTALLYGCVDDKEDPAIANAYTGSWSEDANAVGKIISIPVAAGIPGAAILRIPQAAATGHIVISDGNGGTVEAHSQKRGVIESTLANRRWDIGILVPGIKYDQGSSPVIVEPPKYVIYRLTDPWMTGRTVKAIQQALQQAGYDVGGIDGKFGSHTQAAVIAYQLSKGLIADGEVGQKTAKMLNVKLEQL